MKSDNTQVRVSFAAIDNYIESNIIKAVEKINPARNLVEWGSDNNYPEYLLNLYENTPTLQSIIDGCVDYVIGNGIELRSGININTKGEDIEDIIRQLSFDEFWLGGHALQIIRGRDGSVAETYYIENRHVRTNKYLDVFYYNEKWGKFRTSDVLKYPVFIKNLEWGMLDDAGKELHASSILYSKTANKRIYPTPRYASAIVAAEIEKLIGNYHVNQINNNFTASLIINFNNGRPEDKEKEEIEKNVSEKFCGSENGGRVAMFFNEDKEHATTIVEPRIADFGARYDALSKYSRQQLFTAFRAHPNLFGIPTEGLGFSSEEYESVFKLFNKTQIEPVQKRIVNSFNKIYGEGAITIHPFSFDDAINFI